MQNGKMCKDKRNGLNSDSQKVADYHNTREPAATNLSGIWSLTSVTSCILGERVVNAPIHIRDLPAEGDANYTGPVQKLINRLSKNPRIHPQRSFMQDLLGDEYVPEEKMSDNNQNNQLVPVNVVNLDSSPRVITVQG